MYFLIICSFYISPGEALCGWPEASAESDTLSHVNGTLTVDDKAFSIVIRFLSPAEFKLFGLARGIPMTLMKTQKVSDILAKWCSIEMVISNFGVSTLFLNPVHIFFSDVNRPIGVLVEPGAFFFQNSEVELKHLQAISNLFDTSSIEVHAGQTIRRVLTFRPLAHAFPQQALNIEIDHLYLGFDDFPQKGRFSFKSCITN